MRRIDHPVQCRDPPPHPRGGDGGGPLRRFPHEGHFRAAADPDRPRHPVLLLLRPEGGGHTGGCRRSVPRPVRRGALRTLREGAVHPRGRRLQPRAGVLASDRRQGRCFRRRGQPGQGSRRTGGTVHEPHAQSQ